MSPSKAIVAAALASCILEIVTAFATPGMLTSMGGLLPASLTGMRLSNSRAPLGALKMMAVTTSKIGKVLKKPTGALTIGFQVCPAAPMDPKLVEELSMVMRKCKTSIIFSDAASLPSFTAEQSKAKGNFPGPCPVVSWVASEDEVVAAVKAGASGVVVSLSKLGSSQALALAKTASSKTDVIWEVQSVAEVAEALAAGATVVLASGSGDLAGIRGALPKDCVAIAAVEAMQAATGEVEASQGLKQSGFNSVMLASACVGDGEDQAYVKWAVDACLSKQSKEFKITGMTGHVNGHYGTGTFEKSQAEIVWKRKS